MMPQTNDPNKLISKILQDPIYGGAFSVLPSIEMMVEAGFFDDSLSLNTSSWKKNSKQFVTPVDKIKKSLFNKSAHSTQKYLILLTTGAFCPLHKGHLEIMEIAKQTLEQKGHVVLGGYLSPSHDQYVFRKHPKRALSALHRLYLCTEAIVDSDWLMVDPWESLYVDRTVNFSDVILRLEHVLTKHIQSDKTIHVVYVFGSDNASFAYAFAKRGHCICVLRPGYEKEYDKIYKHIALNNRSNLYFCAIDQTIYSSTQIRQGNNQAMIASLSGTIQTWYNKTTTKSENSLNQADYFLRNEGHWAYAHWVNLLNNTMLNQSWSKFLFELSNLIQTTYIQSTLPDTPTNITIHLLELSEQQNIVKQLANEMPIISLDPCIAGYINLGVSRRFSMCSSKSIPTLVARPGWSSLEHQINNVPHGQYILLDDDIATGTTIKNIKQLLPNQVKIEKIVTSMKLVESNEVEATAFEVNIPLDICDSRDFLIGTREGGLVVALPNGQIARAPYMLPYVFPSDRASIPISGNLDFSVALWRLNLNFFQQIKPTLLLKDAWPASQDLMIYLGFNHSDSLESICNWHIQLLTRSGGTLLDK